MPKTIGNWIAVIALVVVLLSVIFIAVDPARRFAHARNANRREDVRNLVEAVSAYRVDHGGNLPSGFDSVTTNAQVIGTTTSGCDTTCGATTTVSSCLDLSSPLVGAYIAELPRDPKTGTVANSDYYINTTADGRVLVGSCDPELGVTNISAVR